MPWSCCSFTIIYMLYIKHPNSNDYMHLALDVSDESRRTVVQNADDRLITHILSFGYITHTVWMSVSVLLFVSFIGLLNTWLSTMSNDSKIGKIIYRNSDRLKWILFRFFSLWKHLTENGCIYIWLPSREKGHSSQNFTNSFLVNDSDYQILSERVHIYNDMALCSESQYRHLSKLFKPNLI